MAHTNALNKLKTKFNRCAGGRRHHQFVWAWKLQKAEDVRCVGIFFLLSTRTLSIQPVVVFRKNEPVMWGLPNFEGIDQHFGYIQNLGASVYCILIGMWRSFCLCVCVCVSVDGIEQKFIFSHKVKRPLVFRKCRSICCEKCECELGAYDRW